MNKISFIYPNNKKVTIFFLVVIFLTLLLMIKSSVKFNLFSPVLIVCYIALMILNIFYRKISLNVDKGLIEIQKKSLFFNLGAADVFLTEQVSVSLEKRRMTGTHWGAASGNVWWLTIRINNNTYSIAHSPFKKALDKKHTIIKEFLRVKKNNDYDKSLLSKTLSFWDYLLKDLDEAVFTEYFLITFFSSLMTTMFLVQIMENKSISPLEITFGSIFQQYPLNATFTGISVVLGVIIYVLIGFIPLLLMLKTLFLKIYFSLKKQNIPVEYSNLIALAIQFFSIGLLLGFLCVPIF